MICDGADLDVGGSVPVVSGPLDPLHFLRTFVSANKPVKVTGATAVLSCLQKQKCTVVPAWLGAQVCLSSPLLVSAALLVDLNQ